MEFPLKIPIVVPIKVSDIGASREIEVILDTGARYTMISWDVAFTTKIDFKNKILEIV